MNLNFISDKTLEEVHVLQSHQSEFTWQRSTPAAPPTPFLSDLWEPPLSNKLARTQEAGFSPSILHLKLPCWAKLWENIQREAESLGRKGPMTNSTYSAFFWSLSELTTALFTDANIGSNVGLQPVLEVSWQHRVTWNCFDIVNTPWRTPHLNYHLGNPTMSYSTLSPWWLQEPQQASETVSSTQPYIYCSLFCTLI